MIIRILILFILIGINGILSSSEIAYLSLNKYNLARKKDKKTKMIIKILEDESSFLSIIQIGITLSGFLASAFASDSFTDILMDYGVFFVNENVTETTLMILRNSPQLLKNALMMTVRLKAYCKITHRF